MKKTGYLLNRPTPLLYTFASKGKNGVIPKAIAFQEIDAGLYNLALLDYDEQNKIWLDDSNTNNGDLSKVMATVAQTIVLFLDTYPTSSIYIEANSNARNRLYHRIMTNYRAEFELYFEIEASLDGIKEPFGIGKQYDSFYIRKK